MSPFMTSAKRKENERLKRQLKNLRQKTASQPRKGKKLEFGQKNAEALELFV